MYQFLSVLLTALIVPLAAHAQPAKQVEVINVPLAVEVTNPPTASPPERFQLVGFTSAAMLGNTGVLGFTLACQAEFPDSRMCTTQEVVETVVVPSLSGPDAWVRPVFIMDPETGRYAETISGEVGTAQILNCSGWKIGVAGQRGFAATATGSFELRGCFEALPVACCALVP